MITLGLSVYPVLFIWHLKNVKNYSTSVSGFAVIIVGLQTKLAFSAAGYPWSAWSLIENPGGKVPMQYIFMHNH